MCGLPMRACVRACGQLRHPPAPLCAACSWKQRLAARPACHALAAALSKCEERLQALLTTHFEERVAAIRRWVGGWVG